LPGAISPDAKTVAASSPSGEVRQWDTTTGRLTARFTAPDSLVTSLAFSPDGQRLLTGGYGQVICWDAATGKELHRFAASAPGDREPPKGAPLLVAVVSPDGRLVAGAGDGTGFDEVGERRGWRLRLWESATGTLRRHIMVETQPRPGWWWIVPAVAFAPDGKLVAWYQGDNVELRNTVTGQLLRRLPIDPNPGGLVFSPAGDLLALASGDSVLLYDPATDTVVGAAEGHADNVTCLAFTPDGRTLVTGSSDTTLLVCSHRSSSARGPHLNRLSNQKVGRGQRFPGRVGGTTTGTPV
jgi:WD40 repeat protein